MDAGDAGGDQEQVRSYPGCRGGEAYGAETEHRHQAHGNAGAGDHFQHAGQNGKDAVAHALDGEADDVHQSQGEEEGGGCDYIAGSELGKEGQLGSSGLRKSMVQGAANFSIAQKASTE